MLGPYIQVGICMHSLYALVPSNLTAAAVPVCSKQLWGLQGREERVSLDLFLQTNHAAL